MSRPCITNKIIDDIKEIIGIGRTSAIENPNKVLEILLPIGGTKGERLYTREETYMWAKQLQKTINKRYKANIYGSLLNIDSTPANGTKITITIPSKLVDYYVNSSSQSPVVKKIGKYQGEIDRLTDRVNSLKRALAASDKNDRGRIADLQAKIDMLSDRIEQLTNEDSLADVIAYGNADMAEVTNLLNKDKVTIGELLYSNKLIHQWETALGNLFNKIDLNKHGGQYSPNVQAVQNIITTAQDLRLTYTDVFNNAVKELFKRQGVDATDEQIFGAKKEISALSANLMDISRTDDIIFQITSKMIKDAAFDTEREVLGVIKKVDDLHDVLKKNALFKQKGFDLFTQEVDGKKTGMLVSRFSQSFYDTAKQLRSLAKKTKDKAAWDNYYAWKKDNMILFDLRKLFNETYNELDGSTKYNKVEIEQHIADLKKQLGEEGYKEYHSRLQEKMELYKADLEANTERINSLEADEVEKTSMLREWVLSNSPFVYADQVYDGKSNKLGDKFIQSKGYKYTYEVPRKYTNDLKKTQWYDPKFEVIEEHKALNDFYKYTVDKYNELYNYLPDYAIEDLQYNYLPEIRKNIAELFSDQGMTKGLHGWYDKMIAEMTTDEMSDVSHAERDPITGKIKSTLPITMVGNKLSAEEKSYDMVKITKAFALMAISYKHKAKIEDPIRILEQVVNNAKEMQTNAAGNQLSDALGRPIATKEGLKNYKAQFEYAIESMVYNKRRVEEGVSKTKLLSTEEKATKASLEEALKNPDLSEDQKREIQMEIDKLGSNIVASKFWDKVLSFAQLKGMGWNLFAPANNTAFAYVSNIVHAAGGEDFDIAECHKAYGIMLNSIGKSSTLDMVNSPTAKKINSMMENWNVVGEIDQAGYKSTAFESSAAKGLQKLAPYELTRRAEYLNQGATFVAMMLHDKVKDVNGKERSLWEAYDIEGKWKTKEFGPEISLEEQKKFKNRLEQVKKSIHGNYDPNSAVKIKKTTLGRAVMMFRSWVAEGFANRFEAEKDDLLLGRKRKGRLITLKEQGLIKGPLQILSQMANFLTFGGAFKTSLDNLSPIDKANMRKNSAEIMLYLSIYTLVLILKSIDSDDDDEKKALNAMINTAFRVQNDMAFFTSPVAFEKITQSSIPAMTIVTDAYKLVTAMEKTIAGDPYYRNGNHRGDLRIRVAAEKNFPGLVQFERTYQGISKVNE